MAIRTVSTVVIGALWLSACATPAPEPIVAAPVRGPPAAPSAPATPAPPKAQPSAPVEPATSAPGSASVTVISPDKPAPPGDIRSVAERRRDRQAFDRCVIQAQAQIDKRGPSAISESPEEICYRQMGMRDRAAVPLSKQ
jgi:hypothetical protein